MARVAALVMVVLRALPFFYSGVALITANANMTGNFGARFWTERTQAPFLLYLATSHRALVGLRPHPVRRTSYSMRRDCKVRDSKVLKKAP